jgi:hypothetical protein
MTRSKNSRRGTKKAMWDIYIYSFKVERQNNHRCVRADIREQLSKKKN